MPPFHPTSPLWIVNFAFPVTRGRHHTGPAARGCLAFPQAGRSTIFLAPAMPFPAVKSAPAYLQPLPSWLLPSLPKPAAIASLAPGSLEAMATQAVPACSPVGHWGSAAVGSCEVISAPHLCPSRGGWWLTRSPPGIQICFVTASLVLNDWCESKTLLDLICLHSCAELLHFHA